MRPTPLWDPGSRRGVLKPPQWEPTATLNTGAPQAGHKPPRVGEKPLAKAKEETRHSQTLEPAPAAPQWGEPGARSWEGALGDGSVLSIW